MDNTKSSLAATRANLATALQRLAAAVEAKFGEQIPSRLREIHRLEGAIRSEVFPGRLKELAKEVMALEAVSRHSQFSPKILNLLHEAIQSAQAAVATLAANPNYPISSDDLLSLGEEWDWLESRSQCAQIGFPLAHELNIAGEQLVTSLNGYGFATDRYTILFQGRDSEQDAISNVLIHASSDEAVVIVTCPRIACKQDIYALVMPGDVFRLSCYELCRDDIVAWSKPLNWVFSCFETSVDIACIAQGAPGRTTT